MQRLMSLIDTLKNGYEKLSGELTWMLDSAASKHMIGDVSLINDLEPMKPIVIDLPNEDHTLAVKQGKVELGDVNLSKYYMCPNSLVISSQLQRLARN